MDGPHRDSKNARDEPGTDRHAQFLRLYTRHQHRILAYIYTLVPNRADAEDLLQDTAVLLWEKFAQFELGTDFIAWACRVAFLKIAYASHIAAIGRTGFPVVGLGRPTWRPRNK